MHRNPLSAFLRAFPLLVLTLIAASLLSSTANAAPIPAGHARIHYHRPDNNYAGWVVYVFGATTDPTGNFCGTNDAVAGQDSFGVYYDIGVDPTLNGGQLGFIIHNCAQGVKDPGPNQYLQVNQFNEAWVISGITTVYTTQPPINTPTDPPIPANHARIHYYRPGSDFGGWSMYVFGATSDPTGNFCVTEDYITGYDSYGAYYDVGITTASSTNQLGFIIHNCSTGVKDPGPNQYLNFDATGMPNEAWVISGDANVYLTQPTAQQLLNSVFSKQEAFWLDRSTVLIKPLYLQSGYTYALSSSLTGSLELTNTGVTGGTSLTLTPSSATLTPDELTRYPQLASYAVLKLPPSTTSTTLAQFLQGQLAVSAVASDGTLKYATGVQYAGVLDDLFYYSGTLGVVFHHDENCWHDWDDDESVPVKIKLWAPTAQGVSLQLFDHATDTAPSKILPMHEHNGVWVADGDYDWRDKYYLFDVKVYVPADKAVDDNITTDPYSIDIALNGVKSRITDLDSAETKPAGWDNSQSPYLRSVNDLTLYELHIRDFSVNDSTVPAVQRGTYEAFADQDSNGMQHLRTLAGSGLRAVHILPSFHFASVNEDKTTWQFTGDLSIYPPDGQQQQAAVAAIQGSDAYNWGYDPVHYFAPEGSYAINPDNRVHEYRTMVAGLHKAGLRIVQDVVFNHTNASGEAPNSNLDEVVPLYYHRLDVEGNLLNGSCCPDTASEHRMMEKLMIDATVLNAREYKIDGFRFDLMSFHFLYNMQDIKNALAALIPEKDGVDGSKIYIYGEGFDFGEVANNAIGPNASQVNLYGYGIGTFNDRIRDGIRGGSPFTDERVQGFATGLVTDSSDYTNSSIPSTTDQLNSLLEYTDWIKVGLTGNLRDYTLIDHTGATVTGAQVNYNNQPAGYTASPIEAINYCSVHDNQTLFDAVQLKSSLTDTAAIRARRQAMAMSLVALGQGVPFFLGADDLLRSKDMDQNSYDSGDWFNKIDWTGQGDNWGIGLPIASQNQNQWPIQQPLLADPALKPAPANIAYTTDAFQELMRIRFSSALFRMPTFAEVQANLTFLNEGVNEIPGVIVMKLDDNGGSYGRYKHIVVIFNATNAPLTFTDARLQGLKLHLHPVQQNSADPIVQTSTFNSSQGQATVPALTTAVFVSNTE